LFDALIRFSLANRSFICLMLVALTVSGIYSLSNLPIDAVPDITNVQVVVLTDAPALGPAEVEQFITIPVENAMNGIPRIQEVRSITQFGFSLVTIVFEEGTDIYWARQQVNERVLNVRGEIPEGFGEPMLGPIATGLGEIFLFEVKNAPDAETPRSIMELRTILDWDVARPLLSVPGVIEVNTFGGELKTYQVELDPQRLVARGISVSRVYEALRRNNSNAGGGYIERNGQTRVIRAQGLVRSLEDLESIVLDTTEEGTPIYVRDVGQVRFAPMIRQGAVTRDGRGEVVTATVLLLAGENGRVVVERVKEKIKEIQQSLPEGVVIDSFYDRATLINKAIATVTHNLTEGGILVIVVLLALLGNLRAGLIVALAIPLSMLFAGNLMLYYGVAGSLMSLGAIDFGLIVDSAVIVMENIVSHLAHAGRGRNVIELVKKATLEVRRPVVFGVGIITLVHLPILALEGVEGKMFRPMAATVIFALTGSLLLSLTATPVLASFFLRSGLSERETLPIRVAKYFYEPTLRFIQPRPIAIALASLLLFAACVPVALNLGGEFIPQLDEGDLVLDLTRPPDASLREAAEDTTRFEAALLEAFPDEIRSVVSQSGRPEIGLEPSAINTTEVYIYLNDPKQWSKVDSKEDLINRIDQLCQVVLPGTIVIFSQPIQLRFSDMLAGVTGDIGIGLYGPELEVLQEKADELARVLSQVPGAADVKTLQIFGLPEIRFSIDRERIARFGINAADVLDVVAALGGKTVGQVVEGQRRFALQVRFSPDDREDLASIEDLKIGDHQGRMIPLAELASINVEDGIYEIWRKDRKRRAMITVNVRGRDLAGFVAEAQRTVAAEVALPPGYTLEWGGTFENLQSATQRLMIVVPLALALIFLLLYSTFGSVKLGLLIFISVPLGAVGGVLALWARGLNFSISAGVGFIALSGVAVLDGLVLVAAIRQLIEAGAPVRRAVHDASMARLRPILMTGLVASLGFVPMAFSTGAGAEVQRPLATVVIGGLLTSMFLKLVVLPAIYPWFDPGRPLPPIPDNDPDMQEDEPSALPEKT
jgi:cobalt-zinc-cadmium resistance protein CzcA